MASCKQPICRPNTLPLPPVYLMYGAMLWLQAPQHLEADGPVQSGGDSLLGLLQSAWGSRASSCRWHRIVPVHLHLPRHAAWLQLQVRLLATCPPCQPFPCQPVPLTTCSPVSLFPCQSFPRQSVPLSAFSLSASSPVNLFPCNPVPLSVFTLSTSSPVSLSPCQPVPLSACSRVPLSACSPLSCHGKPAHGVVCL